MHQQFGSQTQTTTKRRKTEVHKTKLEMHNKGNKIYKKPLTQHNRKN